MDLLAGREGFAPISL